MHFIPSNFTKESSLRGAEYITIPADCTRNWHLTNLHPRASKGNKIMRKLQGEWVLVPHGELKLIICDNLSASENSNMSTKLCEPLREAGKKRMIKEKGKGKRKGQLETSVCRAGDAPPGRLRGKCFRRLWFEEFDFNVQSGFTFVLESLWMTRREIRSLRRPLSAERKQSQIYERFSTALRAPLLKGKLMITNEQSKSYIACFKTSSSTAHHSHFNQFGGITMLSRADSQMQLVGLMAN